MQVCELCVFIYMRVYKYLYIYIFDLDLYVHTYVFTGSNGNELWAMLAEKAYAKVNIWDNSIPGFDYVYPMCIYRFMGLMGVLPLGCRKKP